MSYNDEAQAGGLIDKYWLLNWIIIPIFLIIVTGGIFYYVGLTFSCPYTEDVSSCFPYNMPDWLKIIFVFIPIIVLIILFFLIKYIRTDPPEPA